MAAGIAILEGLSPNPTEGIFIGKMSTLENLIERGVITKSETLLPRLARDMGSPERNWARNQTELDKEIAQRTVFHDVEGHDPMTLELRNNTGFLKKERDYLRAKGYAYDPATHNWIPPAPPPPKVPTPLSNPPPGGQGGIDYR